MRGHMCTWVTISHRSPEGRQQTSWETRGLQKRWWWALKDRKDSAKHPWRVCEGEIEVYQAERSVWGNAWKWTRAQSGNPDMSTEYWQKVPDDGIAIGDWTGRWKPMSQVYKFPGTAMTIPNWMAKQQTFVLSLFWTLEVWNHNGGSRWKLLHGMSHLLVFAGNPWCSLACVIIATLCLCLHMAFSPPVCLCVFSPLLTKTPLRLRVHPLRCDLILIYVLPTSTKTFFPNKSHS